MNADYPIRVRIMRAGPTRALDAISKRPADRVTYRQSVGLPGPSFID